MNSRLYDIESLPEIPAVIKTHWGQSFNATSDTWKLSDIGVRFSFKFKKYENTYLRYAIKLFLATMSYSKSLSHLINFERQLEHLSTLNSLGLESNLIEFINDTISKKRKTSEEYQIWYFKNWYTWCSDMGLPFFNDDFSEYLENIAISGNTKGQAVMSLDEDEGPFNDQELSSIVRLLNKDQKASKERLLAYLFLTLGVNPRSLSLLKWEHFSVIENNGHSIYLLKVPRIKKRSMGEFKLRELDQRVGRIFKTLLDSKGKTEYIFTNLEGEPLAVFGIRRLLLSYFDGIFKDSEIRHIKVTPRRFRYTFATRLVMSGVSKERLADLLDHTDLQHVQVYYDLRHKIKGFLTEAENKKLGTLLRSFEGSINFTKDDSKKDIKYYTLKSNSALGKCGSDALCELNAPYSCFICPNFNAFSDSLESYKEVHSDLQAWKSSRKEVFDENDRIQFQMDEVISALTDLISRIEEEK